MDIKKKTIIWEDNNEPPKNYIWIKEDGKAYKYSYVTRSWIESKSISGESGGSSSDEITADDITTELLENEEILKRIRNWGLSNEEAVALPKFSVEATLEFDEDLYSRAEYPSRISSVTYKGITYSEINIQHIFLTEFDFPDYVKYFTTDPDLGIVLKKITIDENTYRYVSIDDAVIIYISGISSENTFSMEITTGVDTM